MLAADAPPRETLRWHRLACFLPPVLPRGANLSESPEEKAQADADYSLVMGALGACPRVALLTDDSNQRREAGSAISLAFRALLD
jgi:hypothetical protein